MPVTVRGTDILFNDSTTQSTAATGVPSSFSAVGSIMLVANFSTSSLLVGGTIAGSSLLYTPIGATAGASLVVLEGGVPGVRWAALVDGRIYGSRTGNIGAFQPSNTATLSGTWRVLSPMAARSSIYVNDYSENRTDISYVCGFVQRIS
jgi:hypothetical protein